MNKYDEKTDLELSELVALKCGKKVTYGLSTDKIVVGAIGGSNGNYTLIYFDISNPADMWPIIVDNSITINYDTCQAHVSSYFNEAIKISVSKNRALRAAAIVFLMMQEEK